MSLREFVFCIFSHADKVEYEVFRFLYETVSADWDPDLIIYMKTTPETAYERMRQRGRTGEENYTAEYIRQCHTFHEEMFATYDGAGDIITLDGKISTAENVVHVLKYIK